MFPAAFAALLLMGVALALLYVGLTCRKDALGRELKRLENERAELEKRRLNESEKWTRVKSPRSIEAALARTHIVMVWPRATQIVRLDPLDIRAIEPAEPRPDSLKVARLGRLVLDE
jgi:hypothetical protein